ncbi:hypothetical protein ILUMI_09918 [Ignelater luminosus]|uniref:Reverse transcriptase domain-containing protein n=1 Tax=Ignelater luminosus TaxID=2038154 RepID=A0A8K0D4W5_IGNLU|nr:hypothetical protein ILUMI_09918 [Ignelater luminosus]
MDIEDYDTKIKSLLEDPEYQPMTMVPTTYAEKTTKTKIKNSPIDEETQLQVIPREKSSRCPKFYGLPKIHKESVPLRPIVSSIGSPLQLLARYLAKQLQPHAEEVESYVKNASHFVELLKKETVQPDHLLVNFDVVSLFTNVPVDETLEIIRRKYKPPDHIIDLTKHCLKNTYFIYKDQLMGSPLSAKTKRYQKSGPHYSKADSPRETSVRRSNLRNQRQKKKQKTSRQSLLTIGKRDHGQNKQNPEETQD